MENIVEDYLLNGKYDESNPLVILPKKKEKAKKAPVVQTPKILSRSKRKEFQKQVARKQKKLTVCRAIFLSKVVRGMNFGENWRLLLVKVLKHLPCLSYLAEIVRLIRRLRSKVFFYFIFKTILPFTS